jgi:hypothetical protein
VAQVWRRSWKRIRGSPALSNSGLKDLVLRVDGGPSSDGEYEPVILPQPYVLHTLFELPLMVGAKALPLDSVLEGVGQPNSQCSRHSSPENLYPPYLPFGR